MPTAKNMNQLNQMLLKSLDRAMREASESIMEDMDREVKGFYSGSSPVQYQRTGALEDTPRTTAVSTSKSVYGGSVSFEAYLDQTHQYTTGRAPSMELVLEHANKGGDMTSPPMRAVVGNSGFWDRVEEKMQNHLDDALSRHFT